MWNHIKFIKFIKNHIPFWLRIILIRLLVWTQTFFYGCFPKEGPWGSEKKIFVLLSTDYSNLGDHAMTFAHIKLIQDNFPQYKVYEVLVGDTLKCLGSIKKYINKEDIITFKGGGNIGMEYFREELIRRKVIKDFPNNRLIMFPQTVFFPSTRQGKKEFNNTVKVFNGHSDFHAFFRDKTSYDTMKLYVNKNIYLTPDIVFSLGTLDGYTRNPHGAVTCLRRDVEGIYSENDKSVIYSILNNRFDKDVLITDTIKDYKIETKDRLDELESMWETIANAKLIITDRLHGMIFAALLGTPCIILNTYNHKLRGQYDWIKHLNYVFCIDFDRTILVETINAAMNTIVDRMSPNEFDSYFEQIVNCIRGQNG